MRAELKELECTDLDVLLEDWVPEDPWCFMLPVVAHIGRAGQEGADLFNLTVCTARWLAANPPPKDFAFLRHHLLLSRWDYAVLERAVGDLARNTEGAGWDEIGGKLARYGRWEFEDYDTGD
jgi:hypothetical protein